MCCGWNSNTTKPEQNDRHFSDMFERIFSEKFVFIRTPLHVFLMVHDTSNPIGPGICLTPKTRPVTHTHTHTHKYINIFHGKFSIFIKESRPFCVQSDEQGYLSVYMFYPHRTIAVLSLCHLLMYTTSNEYNILFHTLCYTCRNSGYYVSGYTARIEAGAKWSIFCRWHFQMHHLLVWKMLGLTLNFIEICSQWSYL